MLLSERKPQPPSPVALTLLSLFFAIGFPYWTGLEFLRPGIQLFYSSLGPIFLDLTLSRLPPVSAGLAAFGFSMAVQAFGLGIVALKVGHWLTPSLPFLAGSLAAGAGISLGAAWVGGYWSGESARRYFLFGTIAIFLFWPYLPESAESTADALLIPETWIWVGPMVGLVAALVGWRLYGDRA
jgi:hypothetical protein